MKKITLILILIATFATQSFAHCPIPQWCPNADLHQTLCGTQNIDPIEFPTVMGKTLIVEWWADGTRSAPTGAPPAGIIVSGTTSTNNREYLFPVSISGRPNNAGTYHYTVSNTCGVELLHGSITLGPPAPTTPGTIAFSNNPVCTGAEFTASIAAVSNATTYNWTVPGSMTHDGSDGTTITITDAGTTAGSLAISVTATNSCGTSAPSTQNITVNAAPTIGTVTPTGDQTTTQNVAFASTLTVSSTGTPTPTIQWYSNTTATNSGGTSMGTTGGANTNTFTPPSDVVNTAGVFYYAVATNSCGTATTSNTSGRHIVNVPALPAQGCDFVNRDSARILTGGPVTTTVWTIPARAGVASQTWSDLVVSPQCDKTVYNGGSTNNYISDCRNNSTLVGATNAFPGHYFSWCAVMQYADILCPGDWRVPTREDFRDLDILMGGSGETNTRDPSTAINSQSYTSGTNTNNTATTHVPRGGTWGGSRFTAHASNLTTANSSYWSSSENSTTSAFLLRYSASNVDPQYNFIKNNGFALRCVRDN